MNSGWSKGSAILDNTNISYIRQEPFILENCHKEMHMDVGEPKMLKYIGYLSIFMLRI